MGIEPEARQRWPSDRFNEDNMPMPTPPRGLTRTQMQLWLEWNGGDSLSENAQTRYLAQRWADRMWRFENAFGDAVVRTWRGFEGTPLPVMSATAVQQLQGVHMQMEEAERRGEPIPLCEACVGMLGLRTGEMVARVVPKAPM